MGRQRRRGAAPRGDAVRAQGPARPPGSRRVTGPDWRRGLRGQVTAADLRHRRDRAVRLRRRRQPAADRLELRAGPGRARAAGVRQRPGAGRGPARLPQRVRPATPTGPCSTPPSIPRPRSCRRPLDTPNRRDLGRNGSYLVFRQLAQDVRRLLAVRRPAAGGDPQKRWALADAMVGRHRDGAPLVPSSTKIDRRHRREPARAREQRLHLRGRPGRHPLSRSAPISAAPTRAPATCPGPAAAVAPPAAPARLQALGAARRSDRVDAFPPAGAPRAGIWPRPAARGSARGRAPDEPRGLHFICLVANISRQFEFVQNAWVSNAKFDGLSRRIAIRSWATASLCTAAAPRTASASRVPTARPARLEGVPRS